MSDVEMSETAIVEAESKEIQLAKEWIHAMKYNDVDSPDVFKKLFHQLLSKQVFGCFESIQTPILKVNIKEDKCQDKIFDVLEYFLCGEDPLTGFAKLQSQNKPPQLCGKMFKFGEPTFSCRDCGYDGTCVLCIDCFQKSIHKEHQYKMNTSCGSGFCDCGDPEAWKEGHSCELHQQSSDMEEDGDESPIDKLSPELVARAEILLETALIHAVEMICWEKTGQLPETLEVSCNEDSFVTMLFNDEVHTYEEVISTLREAVPGCDREKALAYANTVDREGRSPVRVGNYITCEAARKIVEKGTSGPGRSPLKCKVMHHKVVAHQLFAIRLLGWINKIISYSEGLRRLLCEMAVEPMDDYDSLLDKVFQEDANLWKVARANTHAVFMSSMIMDPEGKKWFAIHFSKNYKKLMDEFVADDHEHAVSATSFSVQIFTVPTLARMLVIDHDVLIVILQTFMEELQRRLADNNTYVLHNPWFQPLRRAQYVLFDLKYILQHKPDPWTDELRLKFQNFLELFLTLLKNMQGMDMVTRKTGQHIETDPEWESAFTLQMRLMPILAMVCEWCVNDEAVFRKAVERTTTTMIEAGKKFGEIQMKDIKVLDEKFQVMKYDVSKSLVSIHLQASRFLAALLVGCHRYKIELSTLFASECKDETSKLFLMEQSLRALVMVAQVHSGMWRRNGYAIINQVFHYQNVKCRPEMYDKDVIMMQTAAALLDPDHFIAILLDKFSILDCSIGTFDESKFDGDKVAPKLTLIEECLSLIIVIIGERYTPGIGQVTSDDFFRREIIHKLCIKAMAHSELVKALPLPDFVVESEHSVDHVIDSVATYKRPGVTGRGLYELKEKNYKEYNPFFYHYSRIEQSKAEEEHRKRAKKDKSLKGCPPPLPPEFCTPFKNIVQLLSSKVLIGVLSTVLSRAASGTVKCINHMHIHQTLHLIALALLETRRYREKGESEEFKFIQAATTTYHDFKETLLKLLENLHDNPHVGELSALIEWLLKTFHDELEAIEERETNKEVRKIFGKVDSSSSLEDEKARKACLAQERRVKVMAQMSALQKAFIRENADLLASMDNDRSMEETEMTYIDCSPINVSLPVALGCHHGERDPKSGYPLESCILCQEQQEVNTKGRAIVMAAFVQRSTVLSRSRGKMFDNGENFDPLYPPADAYWGLHSSSCGHIMHSDCWQGFFDSVVAKERRALRLRQFISVDVNRREFLCPLCGCICNTVLPIIPPLALGKHESTIEDVSLQEYLSSMQDVVMSNLPVLTTNQDPEAKKDNQNVPPSLAERFQALFHTLTRSGSKFSTTLKDMMKVFAQSSYTIGLGLEPNEDDKRVSVMVWTACAYTIQSGESALRAEEKPLFFGFTTRQIQCIGGLTRLAAVIAGIADSNAIKLQCLRLLAPLTPDAIPDVESPSLLDLDIFSLMVKLRLSMPSLQYKKDSDSQPPKKPPSPDVESVIGLESSSSMDMCSFQLCLAAQIVKILLTTSPELDSDEPESSEQVPVSDEAAKIASLWGKVRHWAGLPASAAHEFPVRLTRHLKSIMLPFLRCSALFFHFLTEIPGPDSLKEPCKVDEEWEAVCHYLSVPQCLTDLLQWNQDSNNISSSVIVLAVKRWCTHEMVKKTLANAGVEKLGHSISPNHLIPLPRDYSELINKASLFTCPNSEGDESRAPVLCLICGKMLCSQSYCCQTEVSGDKIGACAAHAQNCGAGVGVFLRVRECQILLMASRSKGSFYNAPYLDIYGETDQGLRRGNPLYLCPERYNKLQKLWWSHSIAEEVAHSLESNRNLLSIDWQIL